MNVGRLLVHGMGVAGLLGLLLCPALILLLLLLLLSVGRHERRRSSLAQMRRCESAVRVRRRKGRRAASGACNG